MKTLIATATLTIMFLSAGAFAGNDSQMTAGTKTPVSNVAGEGSNQFGRLLSQALPRRLNQFHPQPSQEG
jgi:hypothetical protein